MFCSKCGTSLPDGTLFCSNCGAEINANPQSTTAPELPMKWFKFLIWFSLFAGALLNFYNGIMYVTGMAYGNEYAKALVYSYFDGLQLVDILVGIACIGVAAFAIYVRIRLAGFYSNGPALLNKLYAAIATINVLYTIGLVIIGVGEYVGFGSIIINIAVSVIMISVNTTYFKKRAHLFNK